MVTKRRASWNSRKTTTKKEKTLVICVIVFVAVVPLTLLVLLIPAVARIFYFLGIFTLSVGVVIVIGLFLWSAWARIQASREQARQVAELQRQHRAALEAERRRQREAEDLEIWWQREIEEAEYHASLPYKLLSEPWRDYRGSEFEDFVAKIFEINGLNAVVTRGSSDQGVDVIVTFGGCKMAIQVKGYTGKVGNSAVQEVVAGMRHYSCDFGAVVTNSKFTRSAFSLARSNDIWMFDGNAIPTLINGTHRVFGIVNK